MYISSTKVISHEPTVNSILESLEILLDELKVRRRFSHIHPRRVENVSPSRPLLLSDIRYTPKTLRYGLC